jgi:proteic killer suppression protein
MIVNFGDKETESLYVTGRSKKFSPNILKTAIRKLDMVNAAVRLEDLRIPPANRFEMLKGDLKDLYSIRINDQYRIIFKFKDKNAHNVEIVDYHK